MSTMPFKTPEPDSTRGQASIGKAVKINGQIYSKEDLYVDGDVEGTIELQETPADHRPQREGALPHQSARGRNFGKCSG